MLLIAILIEFVVFVVMTISSITQIKIYNISIFPEIHNNDIRTFFGGWQKGVCEFEPEQFDDIFTLEELINSFDD